MRLLVPAKPPRFRLSLSFRHPQPLRVLRTFATRASTMPAQTIDGTAIAQAVRVDVAQRIATVRATHTRFAPHLAIVQVGARPDSSTYVRMKAKAAAETGIALRHVQLPNEATVEQVIAAVKLLNEDDAISGIIVQLPLGDHVGADGERKVTEAISPEKDVDG